MSRARLVLILTAAVLTGAAAGVVAAALVSRQFQASALLTTYPDASTGAFPVVAAAPGTSRTLNSDARLIGIGPVVENALKELPAGTPENVREQVRAVPVRDTFMLEVTALDESADRAAAIANAFANALVQYRSAWDAGRLSRAGDAIASRLASLDDSGPAAREQRRTLESELARIVRQDTLAEPPLEIVGDATSATATATWPWIPYGVIGAAAGLALGLLLIALVGGAFRTRIAPRELARVHDQPLLGTLPRHRSLRAPLSDDRLPADVSAAVEWLAEHFDRRRQEGKYSVLVTSAARFEGRSTVALVLARALERRTLDVLVLEADLVHPKLADVTGQPSSPGLAALAAGTAEVDDVVHNLTDASGRPGRISVVHAGDRVANPGYLLRLPSVHRALETLKREFDIVLIDAPAGFVGDELASGVDCVLVVGRPGLADPNRVSAFAGQLRATHDGAVMGLVLNALRPGAGVE